MKIRRLKMKDAPLMMEWMRDFEVTKYLNSDFSKKTLNDCKRFIVYSNQDERNVHMAISSDDDEYMGTVSLKNIDRHSKNAEFAIVIRKKAMGEGYGWFGMKKILDYGFSKLELNDIYWCVCEENYRACNFYNKHCFNMIYDIPFRIQNKYSNCEDLLWYSVSHNDGYEKDYSINNVVCGCKIIKINTIKTFGLGELSFFEQSKDTPFPIKRVYYISNVPKGTKRGFHAHKKLKQLLFCPYGEIKLVLDDGVERKEFVLNNPSLGVLIEKPVWREMQWIRKNSVLCVAASAYYSKDDYIRDYDLFLEYVRNK